MRTCDANDCTAEATTEADIKVGGRAMTRHYCDDHAVAMLEALEEARKRAAAAMDRALEGLA